MIETSTHIPPLRLFRVTRRAFITPNPVFVTAHTVALGQTGVALFTVYREVEFQGERQLAEYCIRMIADWQDVEEVPMPATTGQAN